MAPATPAMLAPPISSFVRSRSSLQKWEVGWVGRVQRRGKGGFFAHSFPPCKAARQACAAQLGSAQIGIAQAWQLRCSHLITDVSGVAAKVAMKARKNEIQFSWKLR